MQLARDIDAVVFDLDGTLVDLNVDWEAARADVIDVYRTAGIDLSDDGLWELMLAAPEHDLTDAVEEAIARHERVGAANSIRLPLAAVLPLELPVGVCTLNCVTACRIALDRHDLLDHVEVIVGRDSLATQKPDPEPLTETIRKLNVDPAETVFIGDSSRDETTASRAGVAFRYVSEIEQPEP